jgi:voltage-gated potassium channel
MEADDRPGARLRRMGPPSTARRAIRMIISATVVVTALAAVLVRVVDPTDFPTFGDGAWWAVQTVTTVGYGDITPVQPLGRLVAAGVLVYSTAFLSILTAVITTSFIEQARRERRPERADLEALVERLEAILARLEALEQGAGEARPDQQP